MAAVGAPQPTICGHDQSLQILTMQQGQDAGDRWCGACYGRFARLFDAYAAGFVTRAQAAAELHAIMATFSPDRECGVPSARQKQRAVRRTLRHMDSDLRPQASSLTPRRPLLERLHLRTTRTVAHG